MLGFKNVRRLWSLWKDSGDASLALDSLLVVPDASASLAERNRWLVEVAYWLRRQDKADKGQDKSKVVAVVEGHPEHTRLKAFLKLLEQRPSVKLKIAQLLRSILRDNDALSLLCDTGVATKPS